MPALPKHVLPATRNTALGFAISGELDRNVKEWNAIVGNFSDGPLNIGEWHGVCVFNIRLARQKKAHKPELL